MNECPKRKKEHKKLTIIQSNIRNNQFHNSAYKRHVEKKNPIQSENPGTHEKKQWATFV